jgi:tetratricopeptide (TPR) repeat protein
MMAEIRVSSAMDLSIDGINWNELKGGESVLREIEQSYVSSDRTEAFCHLLESLLESPSELSTSVADAMRLRLVALYATHLQHPERAVPHLESLLGRETVDESALDFGQALLLRRSVAPRVAAALSDAYQRLGQAEEAIGPLTLELSLAEPARLREVKRRLAILREEVGDDPEGAFDLYSELFRENPGDAELRARFIALARCIVEGASPADENDQSSLPRALLFLLTDVASRVEEDVALAEAATDVVGFGLEIAAQYAPDALALWLAGAQRVLRHASPEHRIEIFERALHGVEPSPQSLPLLLSAAKVFSDAGASDRALAAILGALDVRPDDTELVLEADRLFARTGAAPSDRVARLHAAMRATMSASQRAALLVTAGRLARDELDDVDRATSSFRAALSEHPAFVDAHVALLVTYAECDDRSALSGVLGNLLQSVEGSRPEEVLAETTRRLAERGASRAALGLARHLLDEHGLNGAALEAVENVAERENDVELGRAVLERRVSSLPPGEARAVAYDRLGEFLSERLRDPVSAASAWKAGAREAESLDDWGALSRRLYERALDSSQDDLEAAEKLVHSYAETQDWAEVPTAFGVLLRAAQTQDDLSRAVELLLALAERAAQSRAGREFAALTDEALWRWSTPGTPEIRALKLAKARVLASDPTYSGEAAEVYRALIESDNLPEDAAEFRAFVERQPGTEFRATELGWFFEWKAAHGERPALALLEWAALQEREFGNPEAAESVYERVLALEPENAVALEHVLRLRRANDDADGVEACLGELAKGASGEAWLEIELERAGLLVDRLGRADEGLGVLVQILEAFPEHPQARERFRAFYRLDQADVSADSADLLLSQALAVGDLDLAVDAYRIAVGAGLDRILLDELGGRLLSFLDAQSTDADRATAGFLAVLGAAPGTRWALDRVKLSLNAVGRFEELFPLYDRAIAATEDENERAELLNEAAVAARDLTGDAERAIAYLVQLYELRPDDARVDSLLERLYERQGHTTALIELLLRRAERRTLHEQLPLRERIAALMLDCGDLERALGQIDTLLGNERAEAAESLLARLFHLPEARRDADGSATLAEAASARLCDLYRQGERTSDVRRARSEELTFVRDGTRRLLLLKELADLHQLLPDQPAAAFEIVCELVIVEPEDEDSRHFLASLAKTLGRADARVEALLAAAARAPTPEVAVTLLREAAEVCDATLGHPERAAELYDLALEKVDAKSGAIREILRAEDPLWARLARPERRVSGLERLASLLDDATERRPVLGEAARVAAEDLRDLARAANSWQTVVDADPSDREAIDGLVACLTPIDRPEALARALELRIALASKTSERRADEKRLARVLSGALARPTQAVELWQKLNREDPKDEEALDELITLLEALSRFDELVELLQGASSVIEEPERLFRKLAAVHRKHTGNIRAAVDALLGASDSAAAAELAATRELDDPALLFRLTSALIAEGRGGEAVRLLEINVRAYGERRPRERGPAHYELARALLSIGKEAEALAELKLAAAIDPGNATILGAFGELSLGQRDLEGAERSYRALLLISLHSSTLSPTGPFRAEIYLRLATLAELRQERDRAEELVASAFECAEASPEEARALLCTLTKLGRDELLLRALPLAPEDDADPVSVCQALAELLRQRLDAGPPSDGLREFLVARSETLTTELLKAKHKKLGFEAFRPLLEVLRKLGQREQLGALLRTLSSRYAETSVAPELELEAAELMLDEPGRRSDAIDSLFAAWERAPEDARVVALLLRVLEEDGRENELVRVLESQIALAESAADQAGAQRGRLELGRVFERAGDSGRAIASYEAAGKLAGPERLGALRAVARLAETDRERLVTALEGVLELEHGGEAADTAVRLHGLYLELGNVEAAERVLVAGLVADPRRLQLSEALVRINLERGNHVHALELLERALALRPDDRALLLRYVAECSNGRAPERAIAALEHALERAPADVELERALVSALDATSAFERALELRESLHQKGALGHEELIAAIAASGLSATLRHWAFREIELLNKHRGSERARQRLLDWLAGHPDDVEALRELARSAKASRQWPDAIRACERLLEIERESAGSLALALELSDVCERAGEPARALPELERLLPANQAHPELRRRLERLYVTSGQHERLARLLLTELDPGTAPARRLETLLRAGELLLEAGAPEAARETLDQALSLAPGKLQIQLLLARAESASGASDEAVARLETVALAPKGLKAPEIAAVFEALAKLRLERDELVEAYEALVQAHRLNRASLRVAWLLGVTAMDLDDHRTAASALRLVTAAPKASAELTPAERAVAYRELGLIELSRGATASAQKLLKKALQEDPANAQVLALEASLHRT